MNCKPGDVAVIVVAPVKQWALGRIVRVVRQGREIGVWRLEEPFWHPNGWLRYTEIEDEVLRPIRDPGDDAQDETLDWLPVPTKEVA